MPRLPPARIGEGFNCVKQWAREEGVYAELYPLFAYFYTQWLVRVGPRLLSCWQRYHTSTNVVESHHQPINLMANAARVNVWDLCGEYLALDPAARRQFLNVARTKTATSAGILQKSSRRPTPRPPR